MANVLIKRRGGPDDCPTWLLRRCEKGEYAYRTVKGSRDAAEAEAANFLAEGGPLCSPTTRFDRFAGDWAAEHLPALAAQTADSYRARLDTHLMPLLGAKQLRFICDADGRRLKKRMTDRGSSPATIAHALRLGRVILAEAVRQGALQQNPWLEVKQKQKKRQRQEMPDYERVRATLANGQCDDLGELLRFALDTGMRRGEILALRWRYVDFAAVEVHGSIELDNGTPQWKQPKSDSGYRRIGLPTALGMMLRERYLRLGRPEPEAPVFPGRDGGWWNPNTVSVLARKRLAGHKLNPSLHQLRHLHASHLISRGVPPTAVAYRLGHADVSVTLGIYGHLMPGDESRALELLNKKPTGRRERLA